MTMICTDCGRELPETKFNVESGSPTSCFRCRVSTVNVGFGGYQSSFRGDTLFGGTLASDNRHTVEAARAQGHDPVPASRGVSHGGSSAQTERLKKALLAKPTTPAL